MNKLSVSLIRLYLEEELNHFNNHSSKFWIQFSSLNYFSVSDMLSSLELEFEIWSKYHEDGIIVKVYFGEIMHELKGCQDNELAVSLILDKIEEVTRYSGVNLYLRDYTK